MGQYAQGDGQKKDQVGQVNSNIKVGIVGGTGYTGVELLRLLIGHPHVDLQLITSRSEAGRPVASLFPSLRGLIDLAFSEPDVKALCSCDLVFFATPNGIAMHQVPELLDKGVRVIDLAADFRLKEADVWEAWYGEAHACPERLAEAVYGLPELNRSAIAKARLVANPGCYPTAVQLGLLPLLKAGVINAQGVVADCKSGVSGAGRGANVGTLLCEASESFKAYGAAGHRHLPEIERTLSDALDQAVGLTFIPHLTPMIRGIHATLYADLTADHSEEALRAILGEAYQQEPFVDVLPLGEHPVTRSVYSTNMCRMALFRPRGGQKVVVLSVIDNLVKGAAGQAVQNMNLMFDYAEREGLNICPVVP